MKYLAVVTTVATREQAQTLAHTLVERRLAACAQISEIESYYHWDGAVQHEAEFRVLFKTTDQHYAEIERAIKELHPYELPAIHAFAMDPIDEPYGAWIRAEVNACA
jgi:periplasmic divalent cation tolerance protein